MLSTGLFSKRSIPLERELLGGEAGSLSLPPSGRWLGAAETEGVGNPQLSVKSLLEGDARRGEGAVILPNPRSRAGLNR